LLPPELRKSIHEHIFETDQPIVAPRSENVKSTLREREIVLTATKKVGKQKPRI
jgi:hypothetical protein